VDNGLHINDGRYQQLIEFSPDAISIQQEDQIIYLNAAGRKLFGVGNLEQFIGKPVWGILLPDSWEILAKRFNKLVRENIEISIIEIKLFQTDGTMIDLEVSAIPITIDGKSIIQAIFRDITDQKRAEEEIKQRNKELAILFNITSTISQTIDLTQILNDSLDEVLQLDLFARKANGMLFLVEDETLTLAVHRGAPEGHPCLTRAPAFGDCLCGLAAQCGEIIISHDCYQNNRHIQDWSKMPRHRDICLPLKARGHVLGVMNLRLPQEQMVSDNDLRLLTSIADQIAVAIENARLFELRLRAIIEERERIARELHDGLAQILGFVSNKATTARLLLKRHDLQNAESHLLKLEEATQQVFVDVREAIIGLRIAEQVDKGLVHAIKEYCCYFSRLNELPVEVNTSPLVERLSLTIETSLQLLRIVQEALSNARKHASPSKLWVKLEVRDNTLDMVIQDNGAGFPPQINTTDPSPQFGMTTMRERAETIGADLNINSSSESGTCVSIKLPIDGEALQCVS